MNTYKQIYYEDLIKYAVKEYADYEIEEEMLRKIFISLPNIENNNIDNMYYEYLFAFKKEIENYIVRQIRKGNEIYQILLAEKKLNVVFRYLNLKKLNNYGDFNRFRSVASNLSDEVVETFKDEFDFNEDMNKQYVKVLNRKFN